MDIVKISTPAQVDRICDMAAEIWNGHYIPLIGQAQVNYMLEKYQSSDSIAKQLEDGYEYYILSQDGADAGYMSIKKQPDGMFLSKFYLLKQFRGAGLARTAFEFLKEECRESSLGRIWLTVNKDNAGSIAVYKKLGFKETDAVCTDIGNGFFMDDYIMKARV